MEFPERLYTEDEIRRAQELILQGYKHRLVFRGTATFERNVETALELTRTADFYDFLRTYIRVIEETDGLAQLREKDATIWANKFTVESPVDAASFFVQKASQMKEYIEGEVYYDGKAERRSVGKRLAFLEKLKSRSQDKTVVAECDRLLQFWRESSLVY